MSVNCNRLVDFDDDTLELKSSLGRSVSIAVHAAMSDCYKAIESLEVRRAATGTEVVYLRAATGKLDSAAEALRGMRQILTKGRPSETFFAWRENLDYERLYNTAVKRGRIPAAAEQWNRLVTLISSRDHLTVTDCLIEDVENLRRDIDSVVETLLSSPSGVRLPAEQVEQVLTVQTALLQFSTFAQMVAYLNAIEPLDGTWSRREAGNELVAAR